MAEFPTYEEMAKNVAEKALDDFLYNGKSIREWMQIIASEDCISRQQAIDKMQEMEDEDDEMYGCSIPEGFDGKRAIEALKTLPSIQPKPKTDVLNKIRAEILEERLKNTNMEYDKIFELCILIIDKYKVGKE